MKWISVKDQLPKENTIVIAYGSVDNEKRIEPQYYTKNDFEEPNCGCCSQIYQLHSITHWMPLPESPLGD